MSTVAVTGAAGLTAVAADGAAAVGGVMGGARGPHVRHVVGTVSTAGLRHSWMGEGWRGWGEGKGAVPKDFLLRRMGNELK